MAEQSDSAVNPIHQMVQQAHGTTDVAAQTAGESSTPPASDAAAAPREEVSGPGKEASLRDPEVLESTIRRMADQRDKSRSEAEAANKQVADLQEQLRQANGLSELRNLLNQQPQQEQYDPDQEDMLRKMQAAAQMGFQQGVSQLGVDPATVQRMAMKEAIQSELNEALTPAQLEAMVDHKARGLSGAQARILAQAEHPELFNAPRQEEPEPPPALPPSHRVQQPTGESHRAPEQKAPTAQERFENATTPRQRRAALNDILIHELIRPAIMPDDGTGRVVQHGGRQHVRAPRKSGRR